MIGVSHPDHLDATLTRAQKLGWLNWIKIQGEIGPKRMDFYVAYIANSILHSGRQFGADANIAKFMEMMPWAVAEADLQNMLDED